MATIVHLTTIHPRGDARILVREAQTLAVGLPHKVILMVADGLGHTDAPQGRVAVHDLGHVSGGRAGRASIGPWRALLAIRDIAPDIVHFHDPELIPLGMVLTALGYKVIYDVHEDVPRQILTKHWLPGVVRHPVAWVMSGAEWCAARAFSAIVPATPKIADRFPAHKTVAVQNFPVATEMILATPMPYAARPNTFVYPGVLGEVRGAVEIVTAIGLLAEEVTDARLDLAGPISPASFADTLKALPGWRNVQYHGEVSRAKVAELLGTARAGLVLHHPIPNEVDAQPIKTFEYMSAGLPVIASDFPVWRRLIGDIGCGIMVDPLKPRAIADAMRWIIGHPAEAEAMGEKGRQAVQHKYNWDTEATRILALYRRLLIS